MKSHEVIKEESSGLIPETSNTTTAAAGPLGMAINSGASFTEKVTEGKVKEASEAATGTAKKLESLYNGISNASVEEFKETRLTKWTKEDPMAAVNVHEAKTHLSELLDRALRGEEIVISRAGRPLARLVPIEERRPREPGLARGGRVTDAFFEPLPPEEILAWEDGS